MVEYKQWSVKYRPTSLKEFLAPESIKSSVQQLIEKRDAHAILIHGESGCGKTTLGRIIANNLTDNPHDIEDINVSDKRKIEDIRSLSERATYHPRGQCRVFILDEVHSLLGQSQSALLKILEEPPQDKVCFILCTDRPNLLEGRFFNRCEKFALSKPAPLDLAKSLFRIIKKEHALADWTGKNQQTIAKRVAEAADFVPREAIQLLKRVCSSAGEFDNIEDLTNHGIKKYADDSLNKVAMKVIMALYSDQRSYTDRVKFLSGLLSEQNDPFGFVRSLVTVHHEVMMNVAGAPSPVSRYYVKELKTQNAVPQLDDAITVTNSLVDLSNSLLQVNVNLNQLVCPKVLQIAREIEYSSQRDDS